MMTIKDAYNLFIHDRKTFVADATIIKYEQDLKIFFSYIELRYKNDISNLSIQQDKELFQDFIIYLRDNNKRPVTIRSYCRSVKSFLNFCYLNDYCINYLKRIKLPKDDALPKMPLYREEVKIIDSQFDLNTDLGKRNYCIFHLMLDCGLRRQEVVNLKIENVLRDKNIIRILDSKGNKSRMTLIPDFLLDALEAYCYVSKTKKGYIFKQRIYNKQITDNVIKQLYQSLKVSSGIERLHAHLLRHTFATSYLLGGGNLEFLRVFLGHSDYTATKNYAQLAAQMRMLQADIYQLDKIFFDKCY